MSPRDASTVPMRPAVPWYIEARPRIIALLMLLLAGLALALPRPAPAAGPLEASFLYATNGRDLVRFDLRTGEGPRAVYNGTNTIGAQIRAITTGPDDQIYMAVEPGFVAGQPGGILRFDGRSGEFRGTFADDPEVAYVGAMTASPDGFLYVLVAKKILRYRLSDGAALGTLVDNIGEPYPPPGIPPRLAIEQLGIGPDNQLYGLGLFEAWLVRYDRASGAFLNTVIGPDKRIDGTFTFGPDGTIYGSQDERTFYPGGERGQVVRYSPTGEYLGVLAEIGSRVSYMAFGPGGLLYVNTFRGPELSEVVLLLNPRSGAIVGEYLLPDGETSCCLSPKQSFTFAGAPPTARPVKPAAVGLTQRSTPALQVGRDELLTVTLTATNRGDGAATNAWIDVPLDPTRVQLLDAQTSRRQTWVSARRDDGLTIETGRLGSADDSVTITLRLRVRPDAPDGPALPARPVLRWQDAASGGTSAANLLPVRVAGQSQDAATLPLTVDPESAAPGVARTARSEALAPNEPVALWYDRPDGTTVALGRVKATAGGAIEYRLTTEGLALGRYTLVAQGVSSGVTLAGAFEVR